MRSFHLVAISICLASSLQAHHPNRETQPVHPRIDVIPPLGNHLPASYRRRYNRPTYIGGKIAYLIAPSSLEAMSWHRAAHRGDYKNHRPRIEMHYFYPKPWEALQIGPRPDPNKELAENGAGEVEREMDALQQVSPADVNVDSLQDAGLSIGTDGAEADSMKLVPVEAPELSDTEAMETADRLESIQVPGTENLLESELVP